MSDPASSAPAPSEAAVRDELRRMTRRSFTFGAGAALLGLAGVNWVRTRPTEDGIPWPLRRVLRWNERIARAAFRDHRLAPTYLRERAGEPRANGRVGLAGTADADRWRLQASTEGAGRPTLAVSLNQVRTLKRVDMVTEFKCVEGWSQIVHWAGIPLYEFMAAFNLGTRSGNMPDPRNNPGDLLDYVSLATPDGDYYVGLDMASALHPQTLLCYEMNGAPLSPEHGAPLRLVSAVKYGYKSIKRIGSMTFTDARPSDYWAERGYDWYAGH